MRISDWSSDVCSSDLLIDIALRKARAGDVGLAQIVAQVARHGDGFVAHVAQVLLIIAPRQVARILQHAPRAVGKPELHALLERSEEHTSELQSLMRISYAVFCLKKTTKAHKHPPH